MKRKRRTTVTVESERLLVISRAPSLSLGWCVGCGAEVKLGTVEEAALIAGISQRAVIHLVEAGQIHFVELESGSLFICLNSISPSD